MPRRPLMIKVYPVDEGLRPNACFLGQAPFYFLGRITKVDDTDGVIEIARERANDFREAAVEDPLEQCDLGAAQVRVHHAEGER